MELTKSMARKLFTESPDWFKKELEKEFGKETFLKRASEKLKHSQMLVKHAELLRKNLTIHGTLSAYQMTLYFMRKLKW